MWCAQKDKISLPIFSLFNYPKKHNHMDKIKHVLLPKIYIFIKCLGIDHVWSNVIFSLSVVLSVGIYFEVIYITFEVFFSLIKSYSIMKNLGNQFWILYPNIFRKFKSNFFSHILTPKLGIYLGMLFSLSFILLLYVQLLNISIFNIIVSVRKQSLNPFFCFFLVNYVFSLWNPVCCSISWSKLYIYQPQKYHLPYSKIVFC